MTKEFGKNYNTTILKRMRQFYWLIQKGAPLVHQISWSNYVELLPINNLNIVNYYIDICIKENLTKRELHQRIKNKEYERLPEETKNKLIKKEEQRGRRFN